MLWDFEGQGASGTPLLSSQEEANPAWYLPDLSAITANVHLSIRQIGTCPCGAR